MTSHVRLGMVLGFLPCVAACGNDPNPGAPCAAAAGQFPPTHCAYVQGRRTAAGTPIAGAGLRVDDFVPPVGYAYASDAVGTDALGRTELLLSQMGTFVDTTQAELILP